MAVGGAMFRPHPIVRLSGRVHCCQPHTPQRPPEFLLGEVERGGLGGVERGRGFGASDPLDTGQPLVDVERSRHTRAKLLRCLAFLVAVGEFPTYDVPHLLGHALQPVLSFADVVGGDLGDTAAYRAGHSAWLRPVVVLRQGLEALHDRASNSGLQPAEDTPHRAFPCLPGGGGDQLRARGGLAVGVVVVGCRCCNEHRCDGGAHHVGGLVVEAFDFGVTVDVGVVDAAAVVVRHRRAPRRGRTRGWCRRAGRGCVGVARR